MKDAGSEAKRKTDLNGPLWVSLGEYAGAVNAALAEAAEANVIERIWNKDVTLWKSEAAHQKVIANSLGWLTVPGEMLKVADELKSFAAGVRESGFQYVMVCGKIGRASCRERVYVLV